MRGTLGMAVPDTKVHSHSSKNYLGGTFRLAPPSPQPHGHGSAASLNATGQEEDAGQVTHTGWSKAHTMGKQKG